MATGSVPIATKAGAPFATTLTTLDCTLKALEVAAAPASAIDCPAQTALCAIMLYFWVHC